MPGVKSVTFLRNEKLQGISRISPSLTFLICRALKEEDDFDAVTKTL